MSPIRPFRFPVYPPFREDETPDCVRLRDDTVTQRRDKGAGSIAVTAARNEPKPQKAKDEAYQ